MGIAGTIVHLDRADRVITLETSEGVVRAKLPKLDFEQAAASIGKPITIEFVWPRLAKIKQGETRSEKTQQESY